MAKELIIQLGMPKTGTTTLENRIFQTHSEYLYLGKHNEGFTPDAAKLDDWILSFKRNLVCKDLPYFEKFDFEQEIRNRFGDAYEDHDKLFLSEESIMGRCIGPGIYGDYIRIGSAYNILNKLKILFDNSTFSSIKFILVLRKQDDLIESFFAEEYHNFKALLGMDSPAQFIEYLFDDGQLEETDSLFRYASLIKHLDGLFGRENVLVLPYEKLKADPEEFLGELSGFMGISPWNDIEPIKQKRDNSRDALNKNGKIAKVQPLRKKLAGFKKRLFGEIPTGLGSRLKFIDKLQRNTIVKLDDAYKKKVLLYYREENSQLSGRVKFISDYHYY